MPVKPKAKSEWRPAGLEESVIYNRFEKLFEVWHKSQPKRTGIHVSSLIGSETDFCDRQIVLMYFFPHEHIKMFGRTLQIFLQGWVMHKKWQNLFRKAGVGCDIDTLAVEKSRKRKSVHFTPDIIIACGKGTRRQEYIIEIKSMNSQSYHSMKGVHKAARIQANMYMWLTGISRAIVLVENKDTQEFKLWIIRYDPKLIRPYVGRARRARANVRLFRESGALPQRHVMCPSIAAAKAARCPVRAACFAGKKEREAMLDGSVSTADGV